MALQGLGSGEFVFCPWPGFALHGSRLQLLRHLHIAIFHEKSACQNVDFGRSFSKGMLSIKVALRQHRVADEPPV
jgi:hypothetical protein